MVRLHCLMAVAGLLFATTAWAGTARSPHAAASGPPAAPAGMQQFQKNTALGGDLEGRVGTEEEYSQVQTLADRGLAAARNLVAANPGNAEAQYILGSWLLYGYRAVTTQEATTDAAGETHTVTARSAVQGLSDDPTQGLEALRKAAKLAPANATYALDYAAALLDTGRPEQAIVALAGAWNGKPQLNQQQKARAGLLVSDSYFMEGRTSDAREWLYSTLLLNPENAEIVRRLRMLDAGEAALVELAPAPSIPETPAAAPSAETAPAEPATPSEAAPAPSAPPSDEMAPAEPTTPSEAAPESSDQSAAPDQGDQPAPQQDAGPTT